MLKAFRESLRLQPQSAESARSLLAEALYNAGSDRLERGAFGRGGGGAARGPHTQTRSRRGTQQSRHRPRVARWRTDEAVAEWRRALEIKPGLDDARRNLERAERAKN